MERKIHFRESWLIFWGILGKAELILGILGAKAKYFQGPEEIVFRDLGKFNAIFLGSKGAQTPLGLTYPNRYVLEALDFEWCFFGPNLNRDL